MYSVKTANIVVVFVVVFHFFKWGTDSRRVTVKSENITGKLEEYK